METPLTPLERQSPEIECGMLDVRWAPEDVDHVMEQAVKGASVWHPDALDLNSGNAFPEGLDRSSQRLCGGLGVDDARDADAHHSSYRGAGGRAGGDLSAVGLIHRGYGLFGELPACGRKRSGAGRATIEKAGADLMFQALETFG